MTICDKGTITYCKLSGVSVDKFVLFCCKKHVSLKGEKIRRSSKSKKMKISINLVQENKSYDNLW